MKAIRYLLFPFAILYDGVTSVRNTLYDIGVLQSKKFKIPVIAVGNLSIGGTGKTPMIEYLIRLLNKKKLAILSRGYKRKTKRFILLNSSHGSSDVGDEPLQFFNKFPAISIAVDANRVNGIQKLQKILNSEVILLDDAYQHRKVNAGYYILLTRYGDLYTTDYLLPTGNLRESSRGAKRADLIVVTKCPSKLSHTEQENIKLKITNNPNQPVFFSTISYHAKTKGVYEISLKDLKDYEVCLITGIANPKPLLEFFQEHEVTIHHLKFPDHHEFTDRELDKIQNRFETISSSKKMVLTTEKDYVRLADKITELCYIEIEFKFLEDAGTFNQKILNYCNTSS